MFDSESAAAEALAAAVSGEELAVPAETTTSEQAPNAASVETTVDVDGATPEDTIGEIDLDSLPPELRSHVEEIRKQFQGDYTRKTQEIAPVRALMRETGMSADDAREALEFVQQLNDPENLKALYDRLGQEFGSPAATGDEDFDLDDQLDPRDKALQDLQSRLEAFEQRQLQTEVSAELDRQEAVLLSQNPQWTENEMRDVARFALSHGGNLLKGAEDYKAFEQRIIGSHLKTKASVPVGATTGPGATGHAEQPVRFNNLDDAHAAALKAYAADLAS